LPSELFLWLYPRDSFGGVQLLRNLRNILKYFMITVQLIGLSICFLGGMVVHRWLARRWFGALQTLNERELLMHGPLASVIINGTVGTYLGALHLFYTSVFVTFFACVIVLLREDTRATLMASRAAAADIAERVRQVRLMSVLGILGYLLLGLVLLTLCRIPSANIDTWAFQLPLAFSVVEHHGFVHPLIGHPFYSHQPLFVNILFAQALAIEPHFFSAAAVNVFIYLFTLLSLAALCSQRVMALLLLMLFIGYNGFFAPSVPVPMTDMPRSCLSVLGLTCASVYVIRRAQYHAALAALCIGAAIATKFTELVSLGLFGLLLLPALRHQEGRLLTLKCFVLVAVVASYWYLKNLILLGNPLYPFLFGHPGLSDELMTEYMVEMTRAFDPLYRNLDHNLLGAQGWRDFAGVLWESFFKNRKLALGAVFLGVCATLVTPLRFLHFLGITVFLFILWYVVMFNHVRWAIPALMMLHVTGVFALLALLERFSFKQFQSLGVLLPLRRSKLVSAIKVSAVLIGIIVLVRQYKYPIGQIAELSVGGVEKYLASNREGYSLYRFVAQQNFRRVYHPYDNGVKLYAGAYNGGKYDDWFVDISQTPESLKDVKGFIAENRIAYFITRPDLKPVEIERLGPAKLQVAKRIIETLDPGAQLLMEDANGWRLYRAGPAGAS